MKFKFSLVLLAFACILVSCKKSNVQGRYIPKNAAFVMHLDGGRLLEKLPWEDVKQGEAFKKAMEDTTVPSAIRTIWANPEESGFDVKKDAIFFVVKDTIGGYVALQLPVADEGKIKTLIESNKDLKITSENNFHVATTERVILKWNKTMFMMVADFPEISELNSSGMYSDNDEPKASRDIAKQVQYLFDLKENESLAKEDKFSTLMNETGDMHFWLNNEVLVGDLNGLNPMMNMVKMDKLYKDNYQAATVNFENGKITADVSSYMSKEVSNLVKKYEGGNVDLNMLSNVPSNDIAFYMGMNFKPEFIRELVKLMGLEGMVTMGLGFTGLNFDDIINFSNGNFLFAMYDLPKVDTTGTSTHNDPNFIFTAGIKDQDATNKIVNTVKKSMGNSDDFNIQIQDKKLAISNSKDEIAKYLKGDKKDKSFAGKFNSSNYAVYANIKYILSAIPEISSDSATIVLQEYNKNFWNEAYLTGGQFKKGALKYSGEVTLQNTSTNSLKQFYTLLNEVVKMQEYRKPVEFNFDEPVISDSTLVEIE